MKRPNIKLRLPVFVSRIPGFKRARDLLANEEIRRRLIFTLFIIVIYRLLSTIPLPGIDMNVYNSNFGNTSTSEASYLLTVFTGGRLGSPSIVGLGIGVYITASIIIQLLTSVVPKLEELSKEGARGKQVLDQLTRWLTLPLGLLYSVGYLLLLTQQSLSSDTSNPVYLIARAADGSISPTKLIFMTLVLTGGSLLLMWLSELITENGLGNGSSLFIMLGIVSSLPALIINDFSSLNPGGALSKIIGGDFSYLTDPSLIAVVTLIVGMFILIAGVVFITESTRKVTIQYAGRDRVGSTIQDSHLPLKLNQSGVLPIIFASSFLTLPQILVPILQKVSSAGSSLYVFATNVQSSFIYDRSAVGYNVLYFIFIIIFSLVYSFIALKPDQIAENLQKSGGFIPGVRPGKSTEDYITRSMIRLTFVGAFFLGFLALVPLLAGNFLRTLTNQQFTIFTGIGGTSLLIVVGVILETARQVSSLRATRDYEKYI